jgi:hypothetical protein
MSVNKPPKHGIEPTTAFRPAGVPIADGIVSEEKAGVVHTKAAHAKKGQNAVPPPLSDKPAPTTSLAARLRERVEKGS